MYHNYDSLFYILILYSIATGRRTSTISANAPRHLKHLKGLTSRRAESFNDNYEEQDKEIEGDINMNDLLDKKWVEKDYSSGVGDNNSRGNYFQIYNEILKAKSWFFQPIEHQSRPPSV